MYFVFPGGGQGENHGHNYLGELDDYLLESYSSGALTITIHPRRLSSCQLAERYYQKEVYEIPFDITIENQFRNFQFKLTPPNFLPTNLMITILMTMMMVIMVMVMVAVVVVVVVVVMVMVMVMVMMMMMMMMMIRTY